MRTSIFLGLLFIASAINPTVLDRLLLSSCTFIAVLVVAMMAADTIDVCKK